MHSYLLWLKNSDKTTDNEIYEKIQNKFEEIMNNDNLSFNVSFDSTINKKIGGDNTIKAEKRKDIIEFKKFLITNDI